LEFSVENMADLGNGVTVIDLNWIMLVSGTVLPFLVALVTARLARAGLKAIVLAALAAVAGFANDITTFLIAVGMHFGLWRPTNLTGVNGTVQHKVPQGVGGRHSRPDGL
jgi:small-conductance mechanosensitive channel